MTIIADANDFVLAKASLIVARTGDDVAMMDFHCLPMRSGLPADGPASDSELDFITAALLTFSNAVKGYFPPEESFDRVIYHSDGPLYTDHLGRTLYPPGSEFAGDLKSAHPHGPPANPVLRNDYLGVIGDSATTKWLPDQVAASITFKTQARRSWGRVYFPMGDTGHLVDDVNYADGRGQFTSSFCSGLAGYAKDLVDELASHDVPLVVWSFTHGFALSVDKIQVDSIPDIQRRRRHKKLAKTFAELTPA